MGLNDEAEKLRQAWAWMESAEVDSEQYNAAYEYIDEIVVKKNFDPDEWKKLIDLDQRRWRAAIVAALEKVRADGSGQSDSQDTTS